MLDKNGLASLVIDAVVRLTESMDVTQRTTVQMGKLTYVKMR